VPADWHEEIGGLAHSSKLAKFKIHVATRRFINILPSMNRLFTLTFGWVIYATWASHADTAGRARAAFNGNPVILQEARALLAQTSDLTDPQLRQIEGCLLRKD
jgi:hypothetical protein